MFSEVRVITKSKKFVNFELNPAIKRKDEKMILEKIEEIMGESLLCHKFIRAK